MTQSPSRRPAAHGAPGNSATPASLPGGGDDAWMLVQAEVDAAPDDGARPRVDLQAAAETALAVHGDVHDDAALVARFAAVAATGEFGADVMPKVQRYASAAWYARHRQREAEAGQSAATVPEALITQGVALFERMFELASYHFRRDAVEGPRVAQMNAAPGHRKLANQLLGLAELYDRHPDVVAKDATNYRPGDARDARKVAAAIVKALAGHGTPEFDVWTRRCARLWTLMSASYGEFQSLGLWLLRATPDVASARFPSLIAESRNAAQPVKLAVVDEPAAPATPAAPVTQSAEIPAASKRARRRRTR